MIISSILLYVLVLILQLNRILQCLDVLQVSSKSPLMSWYPSALRQMLICSVQAEGRKEWFRFCKTKNSRGSLYLKVVLHIALNTSSLISSGKKSACRGYCFVSAAWCKRRCSLLLSHWVCLEEIGILGVRLINTFNHCLKLLKMYNTEFLGAFLDNINICTHVI